MDKEKECSKCYDNPLGGNRLPLGGVRHCDMCNKCLTWKGSYPYKGKWYCGNTCNPPYENIKENDRTK